MTGLHRLLTMTQRGDLVWVFMSTNQKPELKDTEWNQPSQMTRILAKKVKGGKMNGWSEKRPQKISK